MIPIGQIFHMTYHDEADDIPVGLIESMRKRSEACKDMKPCPKCKTADVQLMSWVTKVIWRCRECKHVF